MPMPLPSFPSAPIEERPLLDQLQHGGGNQGSKSEAAFWPFISQALPVDRGISKSPM